MAKTALTPVVSPGSYPTAIAALTWTAADITNGNSFPWTGKDIILAQNTDVGAQTVTVSSVADQEGRSDTVLTSVSLTAGGYYIIAGPLPGQGWRQSDGNIYLSASSVNVKFAIIRLP